MYSVDGRRSPIHPRAGANRHDIWSRHASRGGGYVAFCESRAAAAKMPRVMRAGEAAARCS
jgi:hypothetical protein